jgi:hypothetical protein
LEGGQLYVSAAAALPLSQYHYRRFNPSGIIQTKMFHVKHFGKISAENMTKPKIGGSAFNAIVEGHCGFESDTAALA